MADKNTTLPRTMIDCFTQDALTQIKDTLNGDEVTFPNRGGLGTDVRYLSDFALEQIKNAVGNGGGGGGIEIKEIKSIIYFSEGTSTPTEIPIMLEDDGTYSADLDLSDIVLDNAIIIYFSDKTTITSEDDVLFSLYVSSTKEVEYALFNNPEIGWMTGRESAHGFSVKIYKTKPNDLIETPSENPYFAFAIQLSPMS